MKNQFRILKVEITSPNTIKAILQDEDDNIFITYGKQEELKFKKSFSNKCLECGKPIEDKFELCYSCNEDKRLDLIK
jgi:hypothetical protein